MTYTRWTTPPSAERPRTAASSRDRTRRPSGRPTRPTKSAGVSADHGHGRTTAREGFGSTPIYPHASVGQCRPKSFAFPRPCRQRRLTIEMAEHVSEPLIRVGRSDHLQALVDAVGRDGEEGVPRVIRVRVRLVALRSGS